ncbi:MAG: hypothetical protein KDA59_25365, partial [Planctomycetales bacterium]|nr:hypothetical protein [Planctomycetales bacterium]
MDVGSELAEVDVVSADAPVSAAAQLNAPAAESFRVVTHRLAVVREGAVSIRHDLQQVQQIIGCERRVNGVG